MAYLTALTLILALPSAVDQRAIDDVAAGRCAVARASWWGFDAQDSTAALQAAIDSRARKVVVEKMPGPWIVDKIRLRDDLELCFQQGAEVLAKKGAFHNPSDSLFSAADKKHIKLIGPGATLRMRRADYDGPDYKHAEWRHVLMFHACSGITVEGLTLAESGGDGIYLGAGSGGKPCRDVVIRDVVCDRNYRQGISVISAENLLIERCVLKNTAGTPPAAGIDFEPNLANERLVNCVMRDCVIEDNQGLALHVYARAFDGTTHPMSIRIENLLTRGTNARSASIITSCGPKGSVGGSIELVNCRFEDRGTAGMVIGSKSPRGPKLRLQGCTFTETAAQSKLSSPIVLETRPDDLDALGGIEFAQVTIHDPMARPVLMYSNAAGVPVVDLTGTLTAEQQGHRTEYRLDAATLEKLIPMDRALRIRPWKLAQTAWSVPAQEAAVAGKVPFHRLRNEGLYLIAAQAGQQVRFRLASHPVGRTTVNPVAIEVHSPSGKTVLRARLEPKTEAEFQFAASETGVYRLGCDAGSHASRLTWSSHPAVIASDRGPIHFLATTGDFCFLVPKGVTQFAVRFWGEGDLERVSASVCDPSGKQVWQQTDIASSQSFQVERRESGRDEVWRLRLARPAKGVLEDHYVELRGVPPVVGFSAGGLLHPTGH